MGEAARELGRERGATIVVADLEVLGGRRPTDAAGRDAVQEAAATFISGELRRADVNGVLTLPMPCAEGQASRGGVRGATIVMDGWEEGEGE